MYPKPLRGTTEEQIIRDLAGRRPRSGTLARLVAKTVLALIGAAAFCCAVQVSWAAGQTNDFCTGAEFIPGTGPFPYYTAVKDISLTTTNGDPIQTCQSDVFRSIWYTFTPTSNAIYAITTRADAPTATTIPDTVIAMYTSAGGCAGPFAEVDCNDDASYPSVLQSTIIQNLQADTTYFIVVWQYFQIGAPTGAVQLRITRSPRPENDTCATATPLQLNVPLAGATIGATNDYQLAANATCFTGPNQVISAAPGRDVVFSFTAPRDGEYNFKVYNYRTDNDLVVYVAGSCPPSGSPATITDCLGAANRSSVNSAEEVVCVSLTANQRVFVFVDEHGLTSGSSFTVEATPCYREREPNNAWTNANYAACGITATIQPGSDVDFYYLGAPPAGSRAFVFVDGEAAGTTDFDLRLTTTRDTLEYDDQDNDSAFGSFSPNIAGAVLPGDPVYARINFRGLPTEPYHLYAAVQPPLSNAVPEMEPNGTLAEANFAVQNYYYGTLAAPTPSRDVDTFMFTAEATELLIIGLDGDPLRNNTPINARLQLLDEFGNILVTIDDPNGASFTTPGTGTLTATSPRSPGESFVYRVANDGIYFVRVAASQGVIGPASAGDYLLSISKSCYVAGARFRSPLRLENGTITLRLDGTPGARYRIQYSSDLQTWASFPAVFADSAGYILFDDTTATGQLQRFYRVVSP
jgi:hypothetical protein